MVQRRMVRVLIVAVLALGLSPRVEAAPLAELGDVWHWMAALLPGELAVFHRAPAARPARRAAPDLRKVGGCIDPDGRTSPCPITFGTSPDNPSGS